MNIYHHQCGTKRVKWTGPYFYDLYMYLNVHMQNLKAIILKNKYKSYFNGIFIVILYKFYENVIVYFLTEKIIIIYNIWVFMS